MAQIVIPKNWRAAVSAILSTEDTRYIQWTENARQRYEADFYPLWPYEVYRPIQDYLIANNPTGCPVVMKRPAEKPTSFSSLFVPAKLMARYYCVPISELSCSSRHTDL
jgi:hypothetical protein